MYFKVIEKTQFEEEEKSVKFISLVHFFFNYNFHELLLNLTARKRNPNCLCPPVHNVSLLASIVILGHVR